MHVGQPEIAARIPIPQSLVIEPQQIQHRGVQIVEVYLVLHRLVPVIVRRAVLQTRLHSAARQPVSERLRIIIAAVRPLRRRRPSNSGQEEFHSPTCIVNLA